VGWWLDQTDFIFKLRFTSSGEVFSDGGYNSFTTYPLFSRHDGALLHVNFNIQLDGQLALNGMPWGHQMPDLGVNLSQSFRQLVYRFSSERAVKARSPHGTNPQLAPNAENLAEVLHILQPNAVAFQEFNGLVSEILPQVKWISTRAISSANEVLAWNIDKSTKRDDLGVPLDETGTGIGQVLAILYVVFTSNEPNTIIIDEPQSFLHPALQ
jgi:predicted ATPase